MDNIKLNQEYFKNKDTVINDMATIWNRAVSKLFSAENHVNNIEINNYNFTIILENIKNDVCLGVLEDEQILNVDQTVVNKLDINSDLSPIAFLRQIQHLNEEDLYIKSLQKELFSELFT